MNRILETWVDELEAWAYALDNAPGLSELEFDEYCDLYSQIEQLIEYIETLLEAND